MKKLFAILVVLSLSIPVFAIDDAKTEPAAQETMEMISPEEAQDLHQDIDDDILIKETLPPSPYKVPYGKKNLAKKFLIAMLCVAGCSVFLYGTLSIYNKIRDGVLSQTQVPPEGEKPLDTPNDLTEAVKTFIEKTKWG